MKKHQQHIEDILTTRNVNFEKVDISAPENEEKKQFMRENAKPAANSKTPLPPQLFADDEYLGVSTVFSTHYCFLKNLFYMSTEQDAF